MTSPRPAHLSICDACRNALRDDTLALLGEVVEDDVQKLALAAMALGDFGDELAEHHCQWPPGRQCEASAVPGERCNTRARSGHIFCLDHGGADPCICACNHWEAIS